MRIEADKWVDDEPRYGEGNPNEFTVFVNGENRKGILWVDDETNTYAGYEKRQERPGGLIEYLVVERQANRVWINWAYKLVRIT